MENARIVAVSEYAADDRAERKLVHASTERHKFEMNDSFALDSTSCRGVFVILILV